MIQIPLSFLFREDSNPANFIIGSCNKEAWEVIHHAIWPFSMILLVGDSGCGKSYLASIWAKRKKAQILNKLPTSIFQSHYVVDDIERFNEEDLFHFYNACLIQGCTVLFTSHFVTWHMNDWKSRVDGLPCFTLYPPNDDVLEAFILKFCYLRGIPMVPEILKIILYKVPRSFDKLSSFLLFFDQYLFRKKCTVNRFSVKQAIDDFVNKM